MKKSVVVLGLGVSGRAAVKFLLNRGHLVIGIDKNPTLHTTNESVKELCKQGMKFVPEGTEINWEDVDQVIASPGIPPTNRYYEMALSYHIPLIGEMELACRALIRLPGQCLAITGTNGKTTVTLLTEHVLNQSGKRALALGNVGTPLTEAIDQPDIDQVDVFVLELSSFQLETLDCHFADAAVILNITPDHLDRYASIQDYAAAKIKIGGCLKEGARLFVEERSFNEFKELFKPQPANLYGYSPQCTFWTDTISLLSQQGDKVALPKLYRGKQGHDLENIIASYALCHEVGITYDQFIAALPSFKKPSHRIEFVRSVRGVHYIDDSKGTNIDAVVRAIDTIEGPVVLIAGGVDKGFPYTSWIKPFEGRIKGICAIGQSKDKIKQDLHGHFPIDLCETLKDAIYRAGAIATEGDTILLSPGCSSFDMFKDYAHRGMEFQRFVNEL